MLQRVRDFVGAPQEARLSIETLKASGGIPWLVSMPQPKVEGSRELAAHFPTHDKCEGDK
jgi:hypothetical protein